MSKGSPFGAGALVRSECEQLDEASRMETEGPVSVLLLATILNEGGAERFTSTLLRRLDRKMIRPSLCLLRRDIGYPLPPDVPVSHFNYRHLWHLPWIVYRLRRLIERTRPDVLLSNINATNLVAGMALRGCAHQPAWVARIGISPSHNDNPIRAAIARRTYGRANRFVVNSQGLIGGLIEQYPFTDGRIECIPNPTDFDFIDNKASEPPLITHAASHPLLIAVGRLCEQKRCDVMIEAVSMVARRVKVELWICGEGPSRKALQEQVVKNKMVGSIKLLGFCSNPYSLMRQATLFLLTSDWEGLPNALIEAQGLGLPAVSTSCPYGPDEIVEDGRTGFLVPRGDPHALSEAILRLIGDPSLRFSMSGEARRSARRRFGAGPLTRAWESMLVREVRARGPRAARRDRS
jgi:glycosyltransferase involved in cell wall biosynthesis